MQKEINIEYTKRGKEVPSYYISEDGDAWKKVSPMQWGKNKGENITNEYVYGKLLVLELKKQPFKKIVEWNSWLRNKQTSGVISKREQLEFFLS